MGKWVKGEHYDRLYWEFLDKGGDPSLCPFDTADYKWRDPPHGIVGSDSDTDSVLDEVWEGIREDGLKGESPTDEDWGRWERERQE